LKIVIDMNLSTNWISSLAAAGHGVIHWASVGRSDAPDEVIMAWARKNAHAILTADLGFGGRLIRAGDLGPSVIQLRNTVTFASVMADAVTDAIAATEAILTAGGILTVERDGFRVRSLSNPLHRAD
jgi:predicted nuclease of predicted toxin-antitoxin system